MGRLCTAAAKGDTRKTLEALRDEITKTIEKTDSGRDIAALSKRLMEVMQLLDALPYPKAKNTKVQDAQQRVARRKKT